MIRVGMNEARGQLAKLVRCAESGEEVVITRRGKPAARLVAVPEGGGFAALAGAWSGQVNFADDFDELPAELAESLSMRS